MKALPIAACVLLGLGAASPARAQTPVALPAFDSVELRGGGHVTLRHGPVQRVTLVRGSTEMTGFAVDGRGRLTIEACVRSCRDYDLQIEIVTPAIEAAAVRGGGSIDAGSGFPGQEQLAVAVTGGGAIDLRGIRARNVAAAVTGGGSILTSAEDSLAANVSGGGEIAYWGDPQVTQAVSGGGAVARGGAR